MKTNSGNLRIRLVPIVLLKDLHVDTVNEYFSYIISHSDDTQFLLKNLNNSEIRLRLVQYFLSYKLGQVFIGHYTEFGDCCYKYSELINIFGSEVATAFNKILKLEIPSISRLKKRNVSRPSNGYLKDVLEEVEITYDTVLQSFQEIFVNLVDKKEIPARQSFKDGYINETLRGRLLQGLSFSDITTTICNKLKIEPNEYYNNILSVCLDICNDTGISVPIICNSNNCCYRAFRHGELGKKSKNNVFLFYNFLDAFCESNQYDYTKGFDKLLLEKLAVLFYRVGASTNILDTTYDYNDPEAIDIGFYLMGAILIDNSREHNNMYPNGGDDWFIKSHCFNLFKLNNDNKFYYDKIPSPEGCSTAGDSLLRARVYGEAIGHALILKKSKDQIGNEGLALNAKRLTLLVSCYSMIDVACAIGVELNIIYNWILPIAQKKQFNPKVFINFHNSNVYKAFNQALFKFKNSFTSSRNVNEIIKQVSQYIQWCVKEKRVSSNIKYAWGEISSSLKIGQAPGFTWNDLKLEYNKEIISVVVNNFIETTILGVHLIYIRYLIERYQNIINPTILYEHEFTFCDSNGKKYVRKLVRSRAKNANLKTSGLIGYRTVPGKNFKNKTTNSTVSFNYKGHSYNFKIIHINPEGLRTDSQYELEEYEANVSSIIDSANFISEYCTIDNVKKSFLEIHNKMNRLQINDNKYNIQNEIQKTITFLERRHLIIASWLKKTKTIYAASKQSFSTLLQDGISCDI